MVVLRDRAVSYKRGTPVGIVLGVSLLPAGRKEGGGWYTREPLESGGGGRSSVVNGRVGMNKGVCARLGFICIRDDERPS